MSVPVNLYVDRMSPVQPVRVADIYSVTQDRASAYSEAARKIGLTTREYAEFREALTGGSVLYVRLPRHIDAMAGVHRNGSVYALRNVVVPSGTMGWQVHLADGTTVLIPRVCGNLSMNRGRSIAQHPRTVAAAVHKQRKALRPAAPVASYPEPLPVAETPVTFTPPAPVAAPVAAAGAAHENLAPFAALLVPLAASLHGGGSSPALAPATVLPCSEGSNAVGVCQR